MHIQYLLGSSIPSTPINGGVHAAVNTNCGHSTGQQGLIRCLQGDIALVDPHISYLPFAGW